MNGKNDLSLSEFPQVIVVEASAGAGKTLALAKRYLELLINPKLPHEQISLRSILAITFTNKAAFEMKERILELLKKIALDSFSSPAEKKDLLTLLGMEQEQAKKAAFNIVDVIMRHYNFFGVQTIDSFINALLLGCALNIERSASFKIKRSYQDQLSYCLDLVIEQAAHEPEVSKLLENFLSHYLFVENRKGWFPKEDILELMHSLFTLSNSYGRPFQVYKGKSAEVIKLKKHIRAKIEELEQILPEGLNTNVVKSVQNFLDKSKDIFEISQIPQSFKDSKPPMNKAVPAPPSLTKLWRTIHKELVSLSELDATVAYNPYVAVFHQLLDFFQVESKKEDILFLEELNRKVRLLFDQEGLTVAEAYYRLATRFRHYLIDEFQDTSALQWRNLEPMVKEALSSGGSLFYVGDKKQAIYRFRGGDAGLFDRIKLELSQYNVIPKHLTNNWRSQKAIIDFNNKVFAKDNLLKALAASGIAEILGGDYVEIMEIAEVFKDAVQKGNPENSEGYVEIIRLEEKNQEERNQIIQPKLINLIRKLLERFRYQDIAVLTRNNSEVELISSWLLAEKIPVVSEKTLNVMEHFLIKEIVCLLEFLHSPINDLSFAGFILGEIFNQASRLAKEEIRNFIFQANVNFKSAGSLYRKFAKEYPKIWEAYFAELFKNVGFISVYELTAAAYNYFALFANFPQQQAFFMKFLELIKQSEEEYIGLADFLHYLRNAPLEELYVTTTDTDAVEVLTVHKAKGLEFPVVIIPFLGMPISPESGSKNTNSYVLEVGENLGLVRITKNHCLFSKKLEQIYAQSYKRACIDELNNIYVALTRPQYELYIFIPKKSGSSPNKAAFFIPADFNRQGRQINYPQLKQAVKQPAIELWPRSYKNWIDSLSEEYIERSEILNREKILEGNIMHRLLSYVGNCFGKDKKEIVKEALRATELDYPFIADFSLYKEKLEKLLSKNELKNIFYSEAAQLYCEKEVVTKYGDLKRIDRLIIVASEITIVDYKSTASQAAQDQAQVKAYLEIFSSLYPGKNLKGFILYLDDFRLEEVKWRG